MVSAAERVKALYMRQCTVHRSASAFTLHEKNIKRLANTEQHLTLTFDLESCFQNFGYENCQQLENSCFECDAILHGNVCWLVQ